MKPIREGNSDHLDSGKPESAVASHENNWLAWQDRAPSGMQPPNNQNNADHVAVTSAEPESSLTTDQIVDTALSYGHPVEDLFVGFFKRELVTYVRRLEKINQENKSGISSPAYRPNEQNDVVQEGKQ